MLILRKEGVCSGVIRHIIQEFADGCNIFVEFIAHHNLRGVVFVMYAWVSRTIFYVITGRCVVFALAPSPRKNIKEIKKNHQRIPVAGHRDRHRQTEQIINKNSKLFIIMLIHETIPEPGCTATMIKYIWERCVNKFAPSARGQLFRKQRPCSQKKKQKAINERAGTYCEKKNAKTQ